MLTHLIAGKPSLVCGTSELVQRFLNKNEKAINYQLCFYGLQQLCGIFLTLCQHVLRAATALKAEPSKNGEFTISPICDIFLCDV